MFSLRDLRFLICSFDLDVLRAQRIMGFFILIPMNQRGHSSEIQLAQRSTQGSVTQGSVLCELISVEKWKRSFYPQPLKPKLIAVVISHHVWSSN